MTILGEKETASSRTVVPRALPPEFSKKKKNPDFSYTTRRVLQASCKLAIQHVNQETTTDTAEPQLKFCISPQHERDPGATVTCSEQLKFLRVWWPHLES